MPAESGQYAVEEGPYTRPGSRKRRRPDAPSMNSHSIWGVSQTITACSPRAGLGCRLTVDPDRPAQGCTAVARLRVDARCRSAPPVRRLQSGPATAHARLRTRAEPAVTSARVRAPQAAAGRQERTPLQQVGLAGAVGPRSAPRGRHGRPSARPSRSKRKSVQGEPDHTQPAAAGGRGTGDRRPLTGNRARCVTSRPDSARPGARRASASGHRGRCRPRCPG